MTKDKSKILYGSTKTYTHAQGLSCCFRQWRADSHCAQLHGYALQVTIDFASYATDRNGWVVDFGDMKDFKSWLEGTFDHALCVAESDPEKAVFEIFRSQKIARIVYLPEVGCENFARHILEYADSWVQRKYIGDTIHVRKVTVSEHGGNSAYVERKVL